MKTPALTVSFNRSKGSVTRRTHVTTCLGGHILVCLCDKHYVCQLLSQPFVVVMSMLWSSTAPGLDVQGGVEGQCQATSSSRVTVSRFVNELYIVFLPI